jgi:alanyl-tRNA synthetase
MMNGIASVIDTPGLEPDRLYATYFEGDEKENLEPDTEALKLWGRYLPADHILKGNKKDNFWEMGATGPCGPCSELHYDRLGGRNAADLVNKDDPMVIEIWNLVFMQYNREADGKLKKLPRRHVDTGMGFERLTSILQRKLSNYDTDIFSVIFDEIQKVTGAPAYEGKLGVEDSTKKDMAYRVVADHIRTLTFAISDGSAPGPTDRGYVLRRILKRAVRYGKEFLGAQNGFFAKLVPCVVQKMGGFFPKLLETQDRVIQAISLEEDRFTKSVENGIVKFKSLTAGMTPGQQISAKDVYVLYNAFGFPDDLTRLMAEEKGLTIDLEGFVKLMNEKREEARKVTASKAVAGELLLTIDAAAKLKDRNVPITDDNAKYLLGEVSGSILAIWTGKEFKDSVSGPEDVALVLSKTNFYSESGGQIADRGVISIGTGIKFNVIDVQVFGGYVAHIGRVDTAESSTPDEAIKVGASCSLEVDIDHRRPTMSNHTATHLVNHALREVLGDSVEQQGSVVTNTKLRFDFSYSKTISAQQLAKIDDLVCAMIAKELQVYTGEVPLDLAKSINGLRAMFGEKYPNPVRVVSVGVPITDLVAAPYDAKWRAYAIELCGGTHLSNSREAGRFTIIEEGTHAQGVHRLVAVTGEEAREAFSKVDELERKLTEIKQLTDRSRLNLVVNEFIFELENTVLPASRRAFIREELEPLKAEAQKLVIAQQKEAQKTAGDYSGDSLEKLKASGVSYWVDTLEVGGNTEQLAKAGKGLVEAAKAAGLSVAVLLLSKDEANPKKLRTIVSTCVAPELTPKLNASEWAKAAALVLGGKGGGKPEVAQGQGPDVSKTADAAKAAADYAAAQLK